MVFCHFQKNLVINMVKNQWILQLKLESMLQKLLQKTAEATGDLIGNKIADTITSIGKPKEIEEIYIPPEKRQQIIDDLRLF